MFFPPRDARRLRAMLFGIAWLVATPAVAAGRLITLTSADGTAIVGMLYEASQRPAPAVVLVHMLGRSKDEWSLVADRLQESGVTALAIDLRGHGRSGGNGSDLSAMTGDVHAAVSWLAGNTGVRPNAIAVAGVSLGANLAGMVAADAPAVRAAALISPSLEYRGLRLDAAVMKKIGDRPLWLAASQEDPYALRSVKELAGEHPTREQRLSAVRGHGSVLLNADPDLGRALVDWLKARLIS